jgi:hypothetical protein
VEDPPTGRFSFRAGVFWEGEISLVLTKAMERPFNGGISKNSSGGSQFRKRDGGLGVAFGSGQVYSLSIMRDRNGMRD